jgi:hypothetical protein
MSKARYAGQPATRQTGGLASGAARAKRADERAKGLAPMIAEAREAGYLSSEEIADYFNRRRVPAARGGLWARGLIRLLIARLEMMGEL